MTSAKFIAPIVFALALGVAAGPPGAADGGRMPAPIGRVLSIRSGLSDLTLYRKVDGQFVLDRKTPAAPLLAAGIDIISEQKNGILEARSNGQAFWLDKREVVTTLSRHTNHDGCDPVHAQSRNSEALYSQGLGNGCK
jgi:hypothetical protein